MNNQAKSVILNALKQGKGTVEAFFPKQEMWKAPLLSKEEKKEEFCTKLEKVFASVIRTKKDSLTEAIETIVKENTIKKIARGIGLWSDSYIDAVTGVESLIFSKNIEEIKEDFFYTTDAGITTTAGGIAENGTIILHPTQYEPRTLSLVPPIHIALVKESELYSSLAEVIEKQEWNNGMPTNKILIASPSRTADIELVLAVGVHGPKKLVVILIEDM